MFSAPDKPDFVRRALGAGYFVRIFFVGTETPEIIANAASVAAEVDRFYVYDNSVDDRDAQLVIRAPASRIVRKYVEPRPWMAPIVQRLSAGA